MRKFICKEGLTLLGDRRAKKFRVIPAANPMTIANLIAVARVGVMAGAAGGIAEIIWVSTYAAATGANAALLAQGVTTAAGLSALLPTAPVALGIVIHMALAIALGIALAFAWQTLSTYWPKIAGPDTFVLAALAGVWVTNFFIILPLISPNFVHLVPYPVSLLSKLLFGLAAAAVLRHRACRQITTRSKWWKVGIPKELLRL